MERFCQRGSVLFFSIFHVLRSVAKTCLARFSSDSNPRPKEPVTHQSSSSIAGFWFKVVESLSAVRFFFHGPLLLQASYKTDAPYSVAAAGRRMVLLSSAAHMKELSEAPETHLSLHAVAVEMFQPKHTMYNFDLKDDAKSNGSIHSRVVRTLMTNSLPQLMPDLRWVIHNHLIRELSPGGPNLPEDYQGHHESQYGHSLIEAKTVAIFPLAKSLVCRVNSRVFFGTELCKSVVVLESDHADNTEAECTEFLAAACQYPQDVFVGGEILQMAPTFLAPIMNRLVTRNQKAMRTMVKYLTPVIEQRLRKGSEGFERGPGPRDCIQFIIDSIPRTEKWDASKVLRELLALWFGSVHQLAMSFVYALFDICDHPEYLQPLRKEICDQRNEWVDNLDTLAFLDSFLKESARLNTSDSVSMRRKVLRPWEFQGGVKVWPRSWVCVPQRAILLDENHYHSPMTFDGSRFLKSQQNHECEPKSCRLTDVDPKFPVWGMGKRTCPGRFYASLILKLMVGTVIQNYDVSLTRAAIPRSFTWRSAIIPRSDAQITFKIRS